MELVQRSRLRFQCLLVVEGNSLMVEGMRARAVLMKAQVELPCYWMQVLVVMVRVLMMTMLVEVWQLKW